MQKIMIKKVLYIKNISFKWISFKNCIGSLFIKMTEGKEKYKSMYLFKCFDNEPLSKIFNNVSHPNFILQIHL